MGKANCVGDPSFSSFQVRHVLGVRPRVQRGGEIFVMCLVWYFLSVPGLNPRAGAHQHTLSSSIHTQNMADYSHFPGWDQSKHQPVRVRLLLLPRALLQVWVSLPQLSTVAYGSSPRQPLVFEYTSGDGKQMSPTRNQLQSR